MHIKTTDFICIYEKIKGLYPKYDLLKFLTKLTLYKIFVKLK